MLIWQAIFWPLFTISVIIAIEWTAGRIHKPWSQWVLLISLLFTPWVILFCLDRYAGEGLRTAGAIVLVPILYLMGLYVFDRGILGPKGRNNGDSGVTGKTWINRHPLLVSSITKVTCGGIAGVFCVGLGGLLNYWIIRGKLASLLVQEPNNLALVATMSTIWICTTFAVAFAASTMSKKRKVAAGLGTGFWTAVYLSIMLDGTLVLATSITVPGVFVAGYIAAKAAGLLRPPT